MCTFDFIPENKNGQMKYIEYIITCFCTTILNTNFQNLDESDLEPGKWPSEHGSFSPEKNVVYVPHPLPYEIGGLDKNLFHDLMYHVCKKLHGKNQNGISKAWPLVAGNMVKCSVRTPLVVYVPPKINVRKYQFPGVVLMFK